MALSFVPENVIMDLLQEFLHDSQTVFCIQQFLALAESILSSYMAGTFFCENEEFLKKTF